MAMWTWTAYLANCNKYIMKSISCTVNVLIPCVGCDGKPSDLTPPEVLCVNHASCCPVVSCKCDVYTVAAGSSFISTLTCSAYVLDIALSDALLSLSKCHIHGCCWEEVPHSSVVHTSMQQSVCSLACNVRCSQLYTACIKWQYHTLVVLSLLL